MFLKKLLGAGVPLSPPAKAVELLFSRMFLCVVVVSRVPFEVGDCSDMLLFLFM